MIQEQKTRVAKSLTIGQYLRLWKLYIFSFEWSNTNLDVQLHLRRADPDLLPVVTSKCKAFVRAQIGWNVTPQPHLLPPPTALPVGPGAPFNPPRAGGQWWGASPRGCVIMLSSCLPQPLGKEPALTAPEHISFTTSNCHSCYVLAWHQENLLKRRTEVKSIRSISLGNPII